MLSLLSKSQKIKLYINIFFNIGSLIFNLISTLLIVPIFLMIIDEKQTNKLFFIEFLNNLNFTSLSLIQFLTVLGIFGIIFSNLAIFLTNYLKVKLQYELVATLSVKLLNDFLSISYEKYLLQDKPEVVKNIVSEIERVVSGIYIPIIQVFSRLIFLLIISIPLIIKFSNFFFISIILIITFYVFIFYLIRPKIILLSKGINLLNQSRSEITINLLENFKVNKIFGKSSFILTNFIKIMNTWSNNYKKLQILKFSPRLLLEIFLFTSLFIILLYLYKYETNSLNLLVFFSTIGICSFKLIPIIQDLFYNFSLLQSNIPLLKYFRINFFKLNDQKENINETQNKVNFSKNIVLRNLSYKYSTQNKTTIKKINLEINKNSIVGFYGESGSGKSTLIDLICGLLKPQEGEVLIDNVPINQNNIKSFQKKIAYVSHSPFLIKDTLKKNIIFFESKEFDIIYYKKILKICELDDFVKESEAGDEKLIGNDAKLISAGEAQRVSLARALYSNKEILILDEFTSNLDNDTQNKILNNLSEINDKTIILVTHRLDVLKICDQIFKFDKGKLAN